ncbi:decarboxylating NADP(+)-dependent phosphogluconate dehydrogenase [Buchnera aphidicola]|uniref:6-phosphogluconate dehydrogenase, decarboxylating n=1 Tax=Buchnera aphidicola (Stegophylla sp.) TaxID=2315800 RepID=A0A4D6YMK5_9GAMM|nr:decarboxylating NADP(+)-dependent phosphogluconate dehydrogenase [Buchnera aphidicola (Stegophylla sp.)]QCI26265.1 decarboxylating NADP(+)-dependent phosphogluconate dehydrogenase [Buchnera aphidicola (Stegophylla sp.)]
MFKNDIGVIGMAVMGRNLTLNIASHGYTVSIFNRTPQKTEYIIKNFDNKTILPFFSISGFVNSLKKPRCILLMVQSGKATDNIILKLLSYLSSGDIIIDGGNSFYKDTIRRYYNLLKYNVNFIGAGISGGEYGALYGPSIMPGGNKSAYNFIKPILKSIAAKIGNESCISYIGPDGSGHYVKMVHNGIEYADMQLIAESYSMLRHILNLSNQDISDIFSQWNQGELNSYLIKITKNILKKKDSNGNDLIDCILDQADTKGTGEWACKEALELHEPLTLITMSVFSRYISVLKLQRILASNILLGPRNHCIIHNQSEFIEKIRQSLYLGKIISYSQGFSQLSHASQKYHWNLKYSNIAKIFRSGCIIQARFLNKIVEAYKYDNTTMNLLLSPYFQELANKYQNTLRQVVSDSIQYGVAIPVFSSAISYYDSYRTSFSSANLIQAQRDYFGAHTYKRYDQDGVFHTNWSSY